MNNKKEKVGSENKGNKKSSKLLKILILVVVLSLAAVIGVIVSDVVFSDENSAPLTETVTVTISGTEIILNGNSKMTLDELKNYFSERFSNQEYFTVALINDTKYPADIFTYNNVVSMLSEFDIIHQPLTVPSTEDEIQTTAKI